MFQLPQSVLGVVYGYDDTFRRFYSTHVMDELKTYSKKREIMKIIRGLYSWHHEYLAIRTTDVSFSKWYQTFYESQAKASTYVDKIALHVTCCPVSIYDDQHVVPYDEACISYFSFDDYLAVHDGIEDEEMPIIWEEERDDDEDDAL